MNFTEELKAQFPVGGVFTPPLLQSSRSELGPLFFNPNPETLTPLFSSKTLRPHCFTPPPRLSLTRFFATSSSWPHSTASSTASEFSGGWAHDDSSTSDLFYNRLRILHCPANDTAIVFFPTGFNNDQLGYLVVSVKESRYTVVVDDNDTFFKVTNKLYSRICGILVNPVEDSLDVGDNFQTAATVGYLLVLTLYSVHWFSVKASQVGEATKPVVSYLGFKLFKTCSIVGACWSPHLPEESVVLLQSGELFMFDVDSCLKNQEQCVISKGKRLRVSWTDDDSVSSRNCKWLGCEFSWHPRILIVARSNAVFLVDLRCDDRSVSLLAKIDMLKLYTAVTNERFVAFCKAGFDGFHFALASESLLVLCDVRKPLMPVLQWAHGLDKPRYIESFRLSELRSNPRDDTYAWANKSGFGIMLGSFWNCEFSLFCCGPCLPGQGGPFASEICKLCKSLYAWELPSDMLLSGCDCRCGSCLVREEFSKDALPEWTDWRQKKETILGFGILDGNLSSPFLEADEFGGFTLIRLMSSGKLEVQRYRASWNPYLKSELFHGASLLHPENNLLSCVEAEDYKFRKRYKYFQFKNLHAHLNGNLTELMDSKMKSCGIQQKSSFGIEIHEILCEKLKVCGFNRFRASPAISFVFSDISLPASVREVALRRMWACLPIELLQLAFSSYSEVLEVLLDQKKASLDFLVIPDVPQLPPYFLRKPFCRGNRWSQKYPRSDAVIGPVLPLPILVTLHEFHNGCPDSEEDVGGFSSEKELDIFCNEVTQVASEVAVSDSASKSSNDHAISLADDRDEMWGNSQKSKPFISYSPTSSDCFLRDAFVDNHVCNDARYSNLISKVRECPPSPTDMMGSIAPDLYDDLCPISLKYDDCFMNITAPELKTFNVLKRQFSRWQDSFQPYGDFCTKLNLKKLGT